MNCRSAVVTSAALLFVTCSICPRTAYAEPSDAEVSAKLEHLTHEIDEHERSARLWYYGWTAFFVTSAASEGAFAVDTNDRKFRANYGVGAITSTIGAVTTIGVPLAGVFAPSRLREMKTTTAEERRLKLRATEKATEEIAEQEKLGQSWLSHVGALAVNGAAGIVLWKGYGYGLEGLESFLVGMAVSEIKIFTQPTWALREQSAPPALSLTISPGGFGVRYTFE